MKGAALWVILLFVMPIRSSVVSSASPAARMPNTAALADQPQVHEALEWFGKNLQWINDEQLRLTAIPAPSFQEQNRAAAVKALLEAEGLNVQTDTIGNVIGEMRAFGSSIKTVRSMWPKSGRSERFYLRRMWERKAKEICAGCAR